MDKIEDVSQMDAPPEDKVRFQSVSATDSVPQTASCAILHHEMKPAIFLKMVMEGYDGGILEVCQERHLIQENFLSSLILIFENFDGY
jgi:hypothetical protein